MLYKNKMIQFYKRVNLQVKIFFTVEENLEQFIKSPLR